MNRGQVGFNLTTGLGNNLFQIIATICYAQRCGLDPVFCAAGSRFRDTTFYGELFRNPINFVSELAQLPVTYKEPKFSYSLIPNYEMGVELQGYYQSYRYFANDAEFARELFAIAPSLESLINDVFISNFPVRESVAVHIRRGDYVGLQEYHPLQTLDGYYSRAFELFPGERFIVFSDDIEWCREVFKGDRFVFMDRRIDIRVGKYIDLFLMAMCKANIIANSTFSWWGAYLNPAGRVVAPANWFGPGYAYNSTEDLFPPGWIVI